MTAYPLLLTATIMPQSLKILAVVDPEIRYKQYIETLIRYITQSDFERFVFCENSASIIPDKENLVQLAQFYGKEIEFLSFHGDNALTEKFTRAYGDQEIIEYAFKSSQFIKESGGFYKVTGRYWVKNINEVIQKWKDQQVVFIKGGIRKNTVHTAFFKCSTSFFEHHFWRKGKLLGSFGNSLERLYYHYIIQSGVNMHINGIHPEFSAIWGTSGRRMDEYGWRRWKTKIFARLGVYDIQTTKFQKGHSILKQ